MLPKTAHTNRPWRIHEVAPDLRLYDVWALPTPGGPHDFPTLVQQFLDGDTAHNPSPVARALFAIRWRLGRWFGWDTVDASAGVRVPSLRERLAAPDLRNTAITDPVALPFRTLYATDDEWAAEMANRTVHCVMHLGWVPDPHAPGRFRGQMAVLVKPNGLWGHAYMAAIAPFRHLLVYPPLMRGIAAAWVDRICPPVETVCGIDAVPDATRSRFRLPRRDYVDTLSLAAASDRSPEWWARTMFEESIKPVTREAVFRALLGLRPHRGGDGIAGWRIAERSEDAIRLTRAGARLECEMFVVAAPQDVHLALAVSYRTRVGAAIWRRVAPAHRSLGTSLLRRSWIRAQSTPSTDHPAERDHD